MCTPDRCRPRSRWTDVRGAATVVRCAVPFAQRDRVTMRPVARRSSSIRPSSSTSRRRRRSPFVFNSPHSGRGLPGAPSWPPRGSTRWRCAAPRTPSSTAVRRRGRPRRAADARRTSRAPISTSTASPTSSTRACSTGACRPSPTPARCGSPAASARSRASSATGRRSIAARLPVDEALRADRGALQALSPGPAPADPAHRPTVRPRRPDRLPFDAVVEPRPRRGGQGRHRPGRPLRHELRAGDPDRLRRERLARAAAIKVVRNKPYAGGFITEHYGEPAARAATPSRSRSTAALYMDERALEKTPGLRRPCPGTSTWCSRTSCRTSAATSHPARSPPNNDASEARVRVPSSGQKKRPLLPAARSLGRKRPRRAAIRRRHRHTALQYIHCAAQ